MARLRLTGDADHDVEIDADGVHVDGEPLIVRKDQQGHLTVVASGGELRAVAAVSGEVVWVGIDGHVFELKAARQGAGRRRATTSDEDALSPPMSATVVRIVAKPGAAVSAGDLLIALEAMKMELAIRAPRDGVVKAVHCREGDLVQPGAALLELSS
jgi:3-methylcrotonyl-CoA carboxylase alpha subunit